MKDPGYEVLNVEAPLANDGVQDLDRQIGEKILARFQGDEWKDLPSTGKQIIEELITDDWGCPPTGIRIGFRNARGQVAKAWIPWSKTPLEAIASEMKKALGLPPSVQGMEQEQENQ